MKKFRKPRNVPTPEQAARALHLAVANACTRPAAFERDAHLRAVTKPPKLGKGLAATLAQARQAADEIEAAE